MKVTVCFRNTKVIVPCGQGELLVSQLIEKATIRYKKAIGKPQDYWVNVISLKSSSDGGILDLDDEVKDVVDDREQIIALFEEQDAPPIPHNGGDGTSASSVGTSSPDIFQGSEYNNNKDYNRYLRQSNRNDVVITQNDLNSTHSGSSLIVRRGSEPTLTKIVSDDSGSFHPDFFQPKSCIKKRWSAITSTDENKSPREFEADDENDSDTPPPTLERGGVIGQEEGHNSHNSSFSTFSRGSSRQSLANNAAMLKWLDAQDRAQEQFEVAGRREPLGGRSDDDSKQNSPPITPPGKQGQLVILPNSSGPLGIHVIPEFDKSGRERGLLIQSVEEGGRVHKDGRIKSGDVIIEINNTSLTGLDFSKAQEVFRQSLHADDLRLLVVKAPPPLPLQPPPVNRLLSPIPSTSPQTSPLLTPESSPVKSDSVQHSDRKVASITPTKFDFKLKETLSVESNSPAQSPAKGPPPPIPARNPTTSLTSARFVATNTRKIGKKIHIQLTKGSQGLGFSVTTRDNLTGGHAPIYIKNILPKGAAIEDGNLQPGDRLLQVNGEEMTGKSQNEVVQVLRNTKLGGQVHLVVSRQVLEEEDVKSSDAGVTKFDNKLHDSTDDKETIFIEISLNGIDTTGLGLNVKGKTITTSEVIQDLGIFVKAIIEGGAAAKDGRMQFNDQLIAVNGESLTGKSNPEAMEVLRNAVQKESSKPCHISLLVSRKVDSTSKTKSEVRISHSDNMTETSHCEPTSKPGASIAINPLVAKLKREQSLRNTSYQIATYDSLVNDTLQDSVFVDVAKKHSSTVSSKGIQTIEGSSVLVEADKSIRMRSNSSSSGIRVRPASTLGFMTNEMESRSRLSVSKSNQDLLDGESKWIKDFEKSRELEDEKSPMEDIDPATAFQREGFGRQSMSEKRKGHIDPRMTEFYQKIKSSKESGTSQFISGSDQDRLTYWKRIASAESLLSSNRMSVHELNHEAVGPVLGLKKSSSMESLQKAVQDEENDKHGKSKGKLSGRGINESFRAAVDRSYEQTGEAMDTGNHGYIDYFLTVDEESSEAGSVSQEGRSRASSVSVSEADKRNKKAKKDKEKEKGLFKGFFKLGKNKKESKGKSTEELADSERNKENIHKPVSDRDWLREQRQMAADKQRLAEQNQKEDAQRMEQQTFQRPLSPPLLGISRADKIQQLRYEHQRRHRERRGQYPLDAEEERKIQELERQKNAARNSSSSSHIENFAIPPRQRIDDSLKYERARPAFVDGDHYSHYQNIKEIQAHLHKHDHYQLRHQQMASQYTPTQHYSREVQHMPPSHDRYSQRGYDVHHVTSNPRMNYAYYTPHHHMAYRTTTPHSHTPVNHGVYTSHSATPHIIINPPPHEYSRSRAYTEYDPEPQTAYRDSFYASLPRRREHRDVHNSAQV